MRRFVALIAVLACLVTQAETLFSNLGKIYESGGMPDFSDFDPSRVLPVKKVWGDKAGTVEGRFLVVADKGDEVAGETWVRSAGFVGDDHLNMEQVESHLTLAEATILDHNSPLKPDTERKAFVSYYYGAAGGCDGFYRWRKAVLPSGRKLLICEGFMIDEREKCKADYLAKGFKKEDVAVRYYAYLSPSFAARSPEARTPEVAQNYDTSISQTVIQSSPSYQQPEGDQPSTPIAQGGQCFSNNDLGWTNEYRKRFDEQLEWQKNISSPDPRVREAALATSNPNLWDPVTGLTIDAARRFSTPPARQIPSWMPLDPGGN